MGLGTRLAVGAAALSVSGLAFLGSQEGRSLPAYPDPALGWRVPTICYGHTAGVRKGDVATPEQCWTMLREDAATAAKALDRCVTVPLNQNQIDALISFTFNIGGTAFCNSTLVRKLNSGDYAGAAGEFPRWNKAGGRVMNGLTKRRAAEEALFEAVSD